MSGGDGVGISKLVLLVLSSNANDADLIFDFDSVSCSRNLTNNSENDLNKNNLRSRDVTRRKTKIKTVFDKESIHQINK